MVSISFNQSQGQGQAKVAITSRKFFSEWSPSDHVNYFNGNVLSKMKAEISFYTFLGAENKRLTFEAATKTISLAVPEDSYNFVQEGWRPGMTIAVEGSVNNNGTYFVLGVTINSISVFQSLTDEADIECSVFDDTPITDIDFYYNLIANNDVESYVSKTDRNSLQRFLFFGLDAADTSTEINAIVGSNSFAWVTNEFSDAALGETSEVKIIGDGISGHKQKFIITQEFSVAPFWLRDQITNFQTKTPPDYYFGDNSLKHICRIDAKFGVSPVVPYTGKIIDENGLSSWFNSNNIRTTPEYELESITYKDVESEEIAAQPDLAKQTLVTVVVTSKSGRFATGTKFIVDFFLCPLDQSDYTNPQNTLRQNLKNDRLFFEEGDAPANGEYYGTPYQAITEISAEIDTANQATISFLIDLADEIKEQLKERQSDNRYFAVTVTCEDKDKSEPEISDSVAVLCDFSIFAYNQDNADLMEIIDEEVICRHYPTEIKNMFRVFEGEPCAIIIPLRIETEAIDGVIPLLQTAGVQVVARKAGRPDFVLEEKFFDTANTVIYNGRQDINIIESRGLHAGASSQFNESSIQLTNNNDGTKKGLALKYSFVARYEYWLQVIQEVLQHDYPIFSDIQDITERWRVMQANGWSLALKFIADVRGYDEHVTEFYSYTTLAIHTTADLTQYTGELKFYSESGEEVNSIIKGGKTLIRATYEGTPIAVTAYAYFLADLPNAQGNYLNLRFASNVENSEADSPFIAPPKDPDAISFSQSENFTLNKYPIEDGVQKFIAEAWFDDTKQNWGIQNNDIVIYARFGYPFEMPPPEPLRSFSDEEAHLWADGEQTLFENT